MILRGGFKPSVSIVERIAQEHLRRVEPAVLAIGQRVDAGQPRGKLLERAVALAGVEIAGEKAGPGHGAVGGKRNVIGHAFRPCYGDLCGAGRAVDLVERGAGDAAGEQPA
jgi:hypothetical protein